jgi:hypothetical protein
MKIYKLSFVEKGMLFEAHFTSHEAAIETWRNTFSKMKMEETPVPSVEVIEVYERSTHL